MIENEAQFTNSNQSEMGGEIEGLPASNNYHDNTFEIDTEYKGDRLTNKLQGTFRIGFVNINGIPDNNESNKNTNILETINKCEFDHIGLAEVNKNWNKVPMNHKWHSRTASWWENSKSVTGFNTKDCIDEIDQPGGVVGISIGDSTSRITNTGKDTILGRWCWTTLRGSNNIKTSIITAYRPARGQGGYKTVYSQHMRVWNANNRQGCARQFWLDNLKTLITNKMNEGEQIILMCDMNKEVYSKKIKEWAQETGLTEVITEKCQIHPATVNNGSKTIDGIFTNHSLTVRRAGYLEFGLF